MRAQVTDSLPHFICYSWARGNCAVPRLLVAPVDTCFRLAGYGSNHGASEPARELCEIILLNAIVFGFGSFVISRRQITFYGCRNTACRATPLPPRTPAHVCSPARGLWLPLLLPLLLVLWRLFSKFNGLESHLHFFGCPTLFNIIGAVCWCC